VVSRDRNQNQKSKRKNQISRAKSRFDTKREFIDENGGGPECGYGIAGEEKLGCHRGLAASI